MATFLILVHEGEPSLEEAHGTYTAELRASGALLDVLRLGPPGGALRVGAAGTEHGASDPPLTRGYLVEAADFGAALAVARGCPLGVADTLDVRPVLQRAPLREAGGSSFVFLVLGDARDEAGWVDQMDRIEARSASSLPQDRFLGGVRLAPPSAGRRLARRGAMLTDLPLLEAKEVIGGLFSLRLSTIEEAAAWAAQSAFVAHGTLEIRAPWR